MASWKASAWVPARVEMMRPMPRTVMRKGRDMSRRRITLPWMGTWKMKRMMVRIRQSSLKASAP